MASYDYALGFDAWTGPAEKLPAQPMEPLPPGPDATTDAQDRHVRALADHTDAKRKYEAELRALTKDDGNWSEQRTPLGRNKDEALEKVKEFDALHATNPLVRNVGLYRTPVVKWEQVPY
ncbi:hypothetical protein I5G62_gp37 [Mycobacterium phage CRB2]|uniref:Uncharacterized protein n=1 Tax=Mycobacterium phage CRB2 TaxID=2483623 RepID=A0A455LNA5_9CAUD|nr:hypothetical protein I5G62_gp37 [Mycobacterium phage CRB2]AYP70023.1 hypothetical protein CRB2_37 [Mycobacterium phage CRB2]